MNTCRLQQFVAAVHEVSPAEDEYLTTQRDKNEDGGVGGRGGGEKQKLSRWHKQAGF